MRAGRRSEGLPRLPGSAASARRGNDAWDSCAQLPRFDTSGNSRYPLCILEAPAGRETALTSKPEHIYHAAMLDPHTAAELDPDQITALVDDLIAAHGDWLPAYH